MGDGRELRVAEKDKMPEYQEKKCNKSAKMSVNGRYTGVKKVWHSV
jgi:hypothetical protein